jgi:subtilisin family serine protease
LFRIASLVAVLVIAACCSSATAAEMPRHLLDFTPNDPYFGEQWNLGAADGVDAYPSPVTPATPFQEVRVAIIDGGVDASNPDLAGRVLISKSFVRTQDVQNTYHGTMVAGIAAADTDNGVGLAGIALHVRILDLRVVRASGEILPSDESAAIHYAVDHGARVINLSIGAPRNPTLDGVPADGYSPTEAAAIRYAVRHGVLVVAAAGNDGWRFADWPAALPHVLSVPAVAQTRQAPDFSNRDPRLNDVAAPGVDVESLVPVSVTPSGLTRDAPGGADGLIDNLGTISGTSFSAPHVTAAAAAILSYRPDLQPGQVETILEQTARDVGAPGYDPATGFGELDVAAALQRALHGPIPPADFGEPNDDIGSQARVLHSHRFRATLSNNDTVDAYRIRVRADQRLRVAMTSAANTTFRLELYPGAIGRTLASKPARLATGRRHLRFRATATGYYDIVVRRLAGAGSYRLAIRRG